MSGNPGDLPAAAPPDPKPVAPDPDDYSGCCDSGCTPCIYDRYWEAVARYDAAVAEWESRRAQDKNS